MKRTPIIISTLAAIATLSALSTFAEEGISGQGNVKEGAVGAGGRKDICLVYPEQCHHSVDSIQERIERLNREIEKGTTVYTEDELSRLNSQLRDAKRIWLYMNGDRPTLGE